MRRVIVRWISRQLQLEVPGFQQRFPVRVFDIKIVNVGRKLDRGSKLTKALVFFLGPKKKTHIL